MSRSLNEIKKLAKEILFLETYEDYEQEDLIEILKAADDLYYNDEESFLTDGEYDALRRMAEQMNPAHSYFTGIGSEVRGEAVKLPFKMGSLDQIYEGEIQNWVNKHNLKNEEVIITDKLDGASCLIIYGSDGHLQIAYSRGDGIEGADWTRHIKKIPSLPLQVSSAMAIRAEVIIEKSVFPTIKTQFLSKNGKPYKNPRNMVSGLMNAKENDFAVYKHISVIAYEVLGYEGSKLNQLDILNIENFKIPVYSVLTGNNLTDKSLTEYLNLRRESSDFEIDGVVIDVNSAYVRDKMQAGVKKSTLNPGYAIKYKVADVNNNKITPCTFVEYNTSKHGYRMPRIHLKPIELCGGTVTHTSGFNAAYIRDNKIGPGALLRITRSGDVIPFILEVIQPAKEPQMPEDIDQCVWTVNDKGKEVNLVLKDASSNETVLFEQINDFFASIDAPVLREGNIQKFIDAGYNTIDKIIMMSESQMKSLIGVNGGKIYKGLREKLTNIPMYVLMGSHSAFGRGVGVRNMKKLYEAFKGDMTKLDNENNIVNVKGFSDKTAKKIVAGYPIFIRFLETIKDYVSIASYEEKATGLMTGQCVLFTGFRDKDLHEKVETAGGVMQSSFSKKTTLLVAQDPNSNSGKMQKAREAGVKIISSDELRDMIN